MTLLTDVRTYLTAQSLVEGVTGWKCYIGFDPDAQDNTVLLVHSGGFPQDTLRNENLRPTFQLRVRAGQREHSVCLVKWQAIYDALHDADLSAYNVRLIQADASGPMAWPDDKQRICMSMNFSVVVDA